MMTITPAQMKDLETRFMQSSGVPGILLMEHAAMGVVAAIARHVDRHAPVLFLCGPGNNGGDGYAAARLWQLGGGHAEVWELSPTATGDAKTNRDLALLHGVRIHGPEDPVDVSPFAACVDALFGTGLTRPIEGDALRMIHTVYDATNLGQDKPIIAVDIPSGLNGTTGEAMGALPATETVTFHRIKQGLLLRDGPDFTGKLTVQPILIPYGNDLDIAYDGLTLLSPADINNRFRRAATAHKGDMGRVVILAGSEGMAGAAAFCAAAAVKTGAGLTIVICPRAILPIVQTLAPAATCVPLETADIPRLLASANAAAVGCGLGQDPALLPVLEHFRRAACPVVWDADALNLLATTDLRLPANAVITPHPGEAARLLNLPTSAIITAPLDALHALHTRFGCTILLKGARTLITDGDTTYCNIHATPALAKGGSGDILTGITAALLARRPEDPARTAALAAMIHGLAALPLSENNATPMDIINNIRVE